MMCAVHPVIRLITKIGVKMPMSKPEMVKRHYDLRAGRDSNPR